MSKEIEWPKFERPRITNLQTARKLEKMGIKNAYIPPEEAVEISPDETERIKAQIEAQRRLDIESPLPPFELPKRIRHS